MEKKITIEELYELLCKKLDAMPGLTKLYVGITDDIVRRSEEHKKEYMFTQEIAHGTHAIISNAEKYLIKKFKELENIQSIFKDKGKGKGGEGTSTADKLYISYNYDTKKMKDINDLDDDDFDVTKYELTK